MRDLEQTTTHIMDPEVSVAWLQDSAPWLVVAVLIGLWIWKRGN